MSNAPKTGPKILMIDIETKPMLSFFWRLFDEQGGLAMLESDWSILSWSAKWYDPMSKKKYPVMYADQRKAKDLENEKAMLQGIWDLLDEADIVVGHNVKAFDIKRLNARFIIHDMGKPSSFRMIDTLTIARKHFSFSSNKLEYLAKVLKCSNLKMTKRIFSGFELWRECLARNPKAWAEMEKYNKQDVIVLEEVYKKLIPWDNSINFSVFYGGEDVCGCGSKEWRNKGTVTTNTGIYTRYKCKKCGHERKHPMNELPLAIRKQMLKK